MKSIVSRINDEIIRSYNAGVREGIFYFGRNAVVEYNRYLRKNGKPILNKDTVLNRYKNRFMKCIIITLKEHDLFRIYTMPYVDDENGNAKIAEIENKNEMLFLALNIKDAHPSHPEKKRRYDIENKWNQFVQKITRLRLENDAETACKKFYENRQKQQLIFGVK